MSNKERKKASWFGGGKGHVEDEAAGGVFGEGERGTPFDDVGPRGIGTGAVEAERAAQTGGVGQRGNGFGDGCAVDGVAEFYGRGAERVALERDDGGAVRVATAEETCRSRDKRRGRAEWRL